ncbi:MAG: caspase family protein [Flavobacteriales bacterium]|nr:caspase family protein [Flavobacteriales bacterium]
MKTALALCLVLFLMSSAFGQEKKRCRNMRAGLEDPKSFTVLDLSLKNLRVLSPDIGQFTNLKRLDLSNNRLTELPPEIGLLKQLEELDVSFNQLKSLPPEIANLTHLKNINVSFNAITTLPPEIGSLTHLRALNLSFNKITTLPPELGELEELKILTVKLNPLSSLPEEMAALKNLSASCKKSIYTCVKRNNPSFAEKAKEKYFYQYKEQHEEKSTAQPKDEAQESDQAVNSKKKPELDLSFFSTTELKDMYRDAFNRKDYDNVQIIQDELATRTNTASTAGENTAEYRGSGDPLKGLNVAKVPAGITVGKYFALIIGVDDYKGVWKPLKNAVSDARAVEQLLRSEYRFDNFQTLYNQDASGRNIIAALEWLVANVTEKDNVFIYYSGHGEFKEKLNKGYWVPVDVETKSTYGFISNSDIQTFLGGIKSNHTLLASDACFSGDIFRGETVSVPFEDSDKYYKKVHGLVSRQAITSGGIEPVVDGGRDGHSVFAYYFLKVLRNNTSQYYDASQLYHDIKIPVVNNSDQSPQFQSIKNTGDEGGQFLFIRK